MILEYVLLSAAVWKNGTTACSTPALQQLLNEGATYAEFVSYLLLCIVRMILKELDDLFAEVVGVWSHAPILSGDHPYMQLKTDLRMYWPLILLLQGLVIQMPSILFQFRLNRQQRFYQHLTRSTPTIMLNQFYSLRYFSSTLRLVSQ